MSVLLSLAAMANDKHEGWEPKSTKNKHLFVVKADRKFVGAKVEILDGTGGLIAEQTLIKRKMLVDFDDVKTGTYTIRISKGNEVKEYQYMKK
jgi:hypothetical protein